MSLKEAEAAVKDEYQLRRKVENFVRKYPYKTLSGTVFANGEEYEFEIRRKEKHGGIR